MNILRIVAPIYHIEVTETISLLSEFRFNFTTNSHETGTKLFDDERFVRYFGQQYVNDLNANACFYFEEDIDEVYKQYPFFTTHIEFAFTLINYLSRFFTLASLHSDNAVTTGQMAVVIGDFDNLSYARTSETNSNASGYLEKSFLNKDVYLKAENLMILIKEIMKFEKSVIQDDLPKAGSKDGSKPYVSSWTRYEGKVDRISRALLLYEQARKTVDLRVKISYYVVTLECIYSLDDNTEVSHKVSERSALLLGLNKDEKKKIMYDVKGAYAIRSKFLHGQEITVKHGKKTSPITHKELTACSIAIHMIVSRSLLKMFSSPALFNDNERLSGHFIDLLFD